MDLSAIIQNLYYDIGGDNRISYISQNYAQEPRVSYSFNSSSKLIPQSGGISKIGSPMAEQTREEVDAKIAASEARVDGKFARIEGKIDLLLMKMDGFGETNRETRNAVRDENRSTRANQWIIGFGLIASLFAIASLFPVFFGIGTSIKDMVDHAVEAAINK